MTHVSASLAAVLLLTSCLPSPTFGADGALISPVDELRFQPPKEKGRAELVDGKFGKAERLHFDEGSQSVFFTSNLRGNPDWDRAEGFSFWVKGDGTDQLGGLEFIYADDYSLRYDFAFPIKGADWTKITVAWRDLVPVLPGLHSKPLGGPDGNTPSKLTALWFGRWWYWSQYPAQTFTVDELRLEPTVPSPGPADRPDGAPLARVLAKLKARQPVTIVTMGDSLTDVRHWANREVSWPKLLKNRLESTYGAAVTIVNPAIGGTQLRQNLVLVPRWLAQAPEPDLVTIFFGGNDWDSGMRGEQFRQTCADAVDRVRWATHGKADVLLVTANPSAARWTGLAELANACREAARDRNAGLADTEAAFHTAGKDNPERLFVHDRVHLSPAGHEIVVETITRSIAQGGR